MSGPPGNKNNLKHGYYSLVRLIKNRRSALDKRTILGKMVLETARQLEADLGGDLSTAGACSLQTGARYPAVANAQQRSCRRSADHPRQDGLKAHPVYQLRGQLIAQRRESLKLLGLKRVSKQVTIADLFNSHDEQPQADTRQ